MKAFFASLPRIVGFRGAPGRAAEATLESLDRAGAEGADAVSLELRLTSDGEVVVAPDAEVVRGNRRVAVASLTVADLAGGALVAPALDAPLPLLRDVLLRYRGEGRYLLELMPGPSPRPGLLEFRVGALLEQTGAVPRSVVLAVQPEPLRRIAELVPGCETGLVLPAAAPTSADARPWPDLPAGCRSLAVPDPRATVPFLEAARAAGLHVHVFRVETPERAVELARNGVASLVVRDPAPIRRALEEAGLVPPLLAGRAGAATAASAASKEALETVGDP